MNKFQIFQDQENSVANAAVARKLRNGKTTQNANGAQLSRRPVLGVVNENKLRVQQPRAAKQVPKPSKVLQDENAQAKRNETKAVQQKASTFNIHVDPPKEKEKDKSKLTVANLKVSKSSLPEKAPVLSLKIQVEEEIKVEPPKPEIPEPPSPKKEAAGAEKRHDDAEISVDMSHLHLPVDLQESFNLDMSMDSLCGSPMSVDKSISARRTEYANSLEHFYNVVEYDEEIYKYLKEAELQHRPKPGYMRKQPDITYSMRSILIDWLVEVADEYNLQSETLFLAAGYIDRFLSYMSVVRGKLQLVGTSAMFIASKFEEIYPPDVGEFVYITDDTYTKRQVLRMEHLILKVLSFDMSSPSALRFALKFCMTSGSSTAIKHLAQYLCELSLLDGERFMHFLPSQIAAAATALARHTLSEEPWPESLQKLTGLRLEQLLECLSPLSATFASASLYPQQAVREKFKATKWSCVALLSPRRPSLAPEFRPNEVTPKKYSNPVANAQPPRLKH